MKHLYVHTRHQVCQLHYVLKQSKLV
uniref:Uncharacterized protein n=1 Tax=Medicago truncatula TaxID=3880 RepID=I3T552_MEDTR|nr:unknown [Medicago truncatula]